MAAIAKAGNGLGSITTVLDSDAAVADQAALDAISQALQNAGHTVAGIDGALAGVMHFAVQGGPDASGYSGTVMGQALSAVCTFNN
tara:strand:+ start:116 stop:373 length:258 start_codon:yes stop_codon:yes gene_type:complete